MTKKPAVDISLAQQSDLAELSEVLNHYIINTTAVALSQPLDAVGQQHRFASHAPAGPYRILAARDRDTGRLLGFADSTPLVPDEAFKQAAVVGLYCTPDATGQGVGGALLRELLRHLAAEKVRRAYAYTLDTNQLATALLRRSDFNQAAVYDEVALKFGKYWSMTIWEKKLAGAVDDGLVAELVTRKISSPVRRS
ncbi:GNAT family N-acetyltransferase [Streptomyces sp. H27-H5]|uniref:GNAT family N-acetyltransferase n=1 Tax=Streptomyces sp. H27-H5 TaxID=2996460 RepID=UPI00227149ED|nr:GNAT family N-acetyltransferase [Streptomyces sp. H27-H5]MCY0960405.1 GNAT family N-acetyltransferase [Streptomyces sp. H27-H5]